jgi:hypothetical protein
MSLKGAGYIVGAWEHPTRKASDKSVTLLHAECAKGALDDAGLTKDDVDAYYCAGDAPGLGPMSMIDYMGLKVRHMDSTDVGGSSYQVAVGHALEAIATGRANVCLITLAGRPRSEGQATGTAPRAGSPAQPEMQFEYPYGPATANMYAMCATRHMHEYGTTSEQLAWIKGRRLASCATQSACDVARRRHGRGRGELADGGEPAAPARLLRHQRWRRRADRDETGNRQKPEAAAGESHRCRRGAEEPGGRSGRSGLLGRALVGPAGMGDVGHQADRTSNTPRSMTASPSPC